MAKIISETIEIKVCAHDSFSPVTISQTIALADNEAVVPAEFEKWCLEHMSALAIEYAKSIRDKVAPQPYVTATQNPVNQPTYGQNYQNSNQQYAGGQPQYAGQNAYQGNSEIDMLLNTNVPKEVFGNTKPVGYATYGFTLRACNLKELKYLAFECRKSMNTQIGFNAKRLLELGWQGLM